MQDTPLQPNDATYRVEVWPRLPWYPMYCVTASIGCDIYPEFTRYFETEAEAGEYAASIDL